MHGDNDPTRVTNGEPTTELTRLTVAQAARVLGMSAEAVRMRLKRGTLEHVKEGKTVYVLLPPSSLGVESSAAEPTKDPTVDPTPNRTASRTLGEAQLLVETLRSEVEFLREELRRREEVYTQESKRREHERIEESRRKDSIIAALTQRIPPAELEAPTKAPSEPQGTPPPETASDEPRSGEEEEPIEPSVAPQKSVDHRERNYWWWWRRIFGSY